jgi:hypothetical protein
MAGGPGTVRLRFEADTDDALAGIARVRRAVRGLYALLAAVHWLGRHVPWLAATGLLAGGLLDGVCWTVVTVAVVLVWPLDRIRRPVRVSREEDAT